MADGGSRRDWKASTGIDTSCIYRRAVLVLARRDAFSLRTFFFLTLFLLGIMSDADDEDGRAHTCGRFVFLDSRRERMGGNENVANVKTWHHWHVGSRMLELYTLLELFVGYEMLHCEYSKVPCALPSRREQMGCARITASHFGSLIGMVFLGW